MMEDQDKALETKNMEEASEPLNKGRAGDGPDSREFSGSTSNSKGKSRSRKAIFREYAEAIITAIVLALIIRAFVVQAFKIPSGSMLNTLQVGDHLLVNKFLYGLDLPFTDKKVFGLRDPAKGDIIVFKYPEDPRRDFIKRVIAAAGDTVEARDRIIYVNGVPVPEPYVIHTASTILPAEVSKRDNFGPIEVPEGKVFMMGDNRENSHDSRYWGFVDHEAIRGKAFIIYWSQDGSPFKPRWGRIGDLIH